MSAREGIRYRQRRENIARLPLRLTAELRQLHQHRRGSICCGDGSIRSTRLIHCVDDATIIERRRVRPDAEAPGEGPDGELPRQFLPLATEVQGADIEARQDRARRSAPVTGR